MSTFDTPHPITAVVEIVAGEVRLVASERDDTLVEVAPRDPNRASDVRIAEAARVDFRNGTLTVTAGRRFISLGRGGAVTVDIALPTASRLHASSASAVVHAEGDFGDCKLQSASGDVTVQKANGRVSISTASGEATIGQIDGDIKFQAASGGLTVRRLSGNLNAQTASGAVVVSKAVTGTVSAQTGSGEVEVGIAEGTAAQLDVQTGSGTVRNDLAPAAGPADGDETLVLRARTGSGDVIVRRAATTDVYE